MTNDNQDSGASTDLKQAMFQVSDGVIGAGILVFVGVLAGNWLDGHLHSSPYCVVALSLLGGSLGLFRLVKKAMRIGKDTSGQTLAAADAQDSPALVDEARTQSKLDAPEHQARREKSAEQLQQVKSAFDFLDQGDT
jgi:F0F1-type ATP synthase assembly protein I